MGVLCGECVSVGTGECGVPGPKWFVAPVCIYLLQYEFLRSNDDRHLTFDGWFKAHERVYYQYLVAIAYCLCVV